MNFINFHKSLNIRVKEVTLSKLFPHENIDFDVVNKIIDKSKSNKIYKTPLLIVCDKTNMIIDGHHRFEALKILGYKKISIIYLNYSSEYIKCSNSNKISKINLINSALNKTLKTSKYSNHHIFDIEKSSWVKVINISLNHFMIIKKLNN